MSETRTAVGTKLYPRGSMVFWTDDPKPYWVIEWQPDNGSGAYWIVNAEGETAVATEDELFQFPQEPTTTLREFWNGNDDIEDLFVCGAGNPSGTTYTHDVVGEGEDYLDLYDVIDNGLGNADFWELCGTVRDGVWEWNGEGSPCDFRGNSYTQIKLYSGVARNATPTA